MAHLGEVATNIERFHNVGINVLAVGQGNPTVLKMFLNHTPLPFPLVADPDRAAYRAFELGRTSWTSFFRPSVLRGFARHVRNGVKARIPYKGADILQLGGDFLLNRAGRIVFAYRSDTAIDRPSVDTLLAAAGMPGR